jgi:hypothetical protein
VAEKGDAQLPLSTATHLRPLETMKAASFEAARMT